MIRNLAFVCFFSSLLVFPSNWAFQASDLEDYQTPQAVLHSDDVSESDTPPDGSSIADESLVDVSEPTSLQPGTSLQIQQDER